MGNMHKPGEGGCSWSLVYVLLIQQGLTMSTQLDAVLGTQRSVQGMPLHFQKVIIYQLCQLKPCTQAKLLHHSEILQ